MAAVLSALLGGILVALVARVGVGTPFKDELLFGPLYAALARGELPPLRELIAGHHGHPYPILKALVAATLALGLPWTWMTYAQVVALIGCLLVLVPQLEPADRIASRVALPTLALALLTPRQWESLYWSMQLVSALFLLASLGAFASLSAWARSCRGAWLLASLLLALVASASNGAGAATLALVCGAGLALRRDGFSGVAVGAAAALGVGLVAASLALAPRSGVGSGPLPPATALAHVASMYAHPFVDPGGWRPGGILAGALALALACWCTARALARWRESLFGLLCLLLGALAILGVTLSRVSAGVFQPGAPRYLPFAAPVAIGCVVLLCRWRHRLLLAALLVAVAAGHGASLASEWRLAPHRRALLREAHAQLCGAGRVHPVHDLRVALSPGALRDLQQLFCGSAARPLRDPDTAAADPGEQAGDMLDAR
jgi:hypothetical protein